MARYAYFQVVPRAGHTPSVLDVLSDRALDDAADYAEAHMSLAVKFADQRQLLDFALSKVTLPGMIAEFGVFRGASINYIAGKFKDGVIYGFDSFEGLHEDWRGHSLTKGTFSLGGTLPQVRENVELIKGWFDETLPPFLALHAGPFAFIHADCDTYEANRSLFKAVGERVVPGAIVVFDEYFGYSGWRVGEWLAWQEFVAERSIRYEYLGLSVHQVAVRILPPE